MVFRALLRTRCGATQLREWVGEAGAPPPEIVIPLIEPYNMPHFSLEDMEGAVAMAPPIPRRTFKVTERLRLYSTGDWLYVYDEVAPWVAPLRER